MIQSIGIVVEGVGSVEVAVVTRNRKVHYYACGGVPRHMHMRPAGAARNVDRSNLLPGAHRVALCDRGSDVNVPGNITIATCYFDVICRVALART